MPVVPGRIDVAVIHAAGRAMVRIQRGIVAEADHVASALRIVAEHVVDLPHREVVVAVALVPHGVAVDQCQERRVGRIPQRPPRVEEGQSTGRVGDPAAGIADRPVVEPPLDVGLVDLLARGLGQEHCRAVGLVVPRLRPLQLLAGEAGGVDRFRLGEIGLVASGLVEPGCPPGQFVVVAAERVVEGSGVGDAIGILAAIGVGKRVQLASVLQEQVGISSIGRPKHDRGRGQSCCRLARSVGAGFRGIELVGGASHVHHFGCTPEGMVGAAVADLRVERVGSRMGLDQPVGAPLQSIEHLRQQAAVDVGITVLHDAEAEHRHRRCHWQGEFHVIPCVVIAATEIDAYIRPVGQGRITSPIHREIGGQVAGALGVVKQQRFLQHVGVVVGAGIHGIVVDDRARTCASEDRRRQRRAESDDQRFVRFHCRIAGDADGDRLRQFTGCERERAAGCGVVAASGGRAVSRCIRHRHRLRGGRRECHRELHRCCAGIALVDTA